MQILHCRKIYTASNLVALSLSLSLSLAGCYVICDHYIMVD